MILSKLKFNHYILLCVLFGVITTLLNYSFGTSDHLEQLPIIYKMMDSNYLINDFFVTNNAGYSPRYYYANLIAFLSIFISVPTLFFTGTLFSNISVSILTFLIADLLFRSKNTGIIAASFVIFLPTIQLGADLVLYSNQFTPSSLVFPLILFSFYLLIKKKLVYCLLTAGLASVFHILIGFEYGMLFLSTSLILDVIERKKPIEILKKSSLFLIIIVFLLPNLIFHYQNNVTIDSSDFIQILSNYRHPHHYLLSEILTTVEVFIFIILTALLIANFRFYKKNSSVKSHHLTINILIILIVFSCILGYFFTEIVLVKSIVILQPLRLLNLIKWIFILLLANFIAKNLNKPLKLVPSFLMIIFLIFFSELSIIKTTAVGILFGTFIFLLILEKKKLLYILSSFVLVSLLIFNTIDNSQVKKYQKSYFDFHETNIKQTHIIDFIKINTNKNSVFLTPSDFGFIRTEAKRAIVIDFKAFPFKETAILQWYQRIEDCYGLNKKTFEKEYKNLNDSKIAALQTKYRFDYAILYQETFTKNPIIYSNSEFKIIITESNAK